MLEHLYEDLKFKILNILWECEYDEIVYATVENEYTAQRMYDELLVDSPLSKEFIAEAIQQAQR